ncbi:MAG: hypothetical protein J0I75_09210 [Hyphomicrobium sp.]|nr:hypothetical protein [Hyphomicrobium sp.]
MELDDIEAAALAVVGFQARRVLIGEATALEGFLAAECSAERVERVGRLGGVAGDGRTQGSIIREEVAALEGGRLIGASGGAEALVRASHRERSPARPSGLALGYRFLVAARQPLRQR